MIPSLQWHMQHASHDAWISPRTFVAKLHPCPRPLERDTTAIHGIRLLSGRLMSEHASAGSAACIESLCGGLHACNSGKGSHCTGDNTGTHELHHERQVNEQMAVLFCNI